MENQTPEVEALLKALGEKKKLVAMLAPSFSVVFKPPEIAGKLKRLGFAFVVEISAGAQETNRQLLELISKNPKQRYVTNPCPTIVRLIRTRYPHLVKYLSPIDSPMSATAKLVLKKYPGYQPVFIGPCPAKKLEAREDWAELNILVLTYQEIEEVFKIKKIKDSPKDALASFDLIGSQTRLYPVSGGLTQSAVLVDLFTDEELDVISGGVLVKQALEDFPTNRLKVLDILFCDGGCIAGPGIKSPLLLEERRAKVISHWAKVIK